MPGKIARFSHLKLFKESLTISCKNLPTVAGLKCKVKTVRLLYVVKTIYHQRLREGCFLVAFYGYFQGHFVKVYITGPKIMVNKKSAYPIYPS